MDKISGRYGTTTRETAVYSGRDDEQYHEGVAIILKKGLNKSGMECKPTNSRLMNVRMNEKHINTTIIIQCYAPINGSEKDNILASQARRNTKI